MLLEWGEKYLAKLFKKDTGGSCHSRMVLLLLEHSRVFRWLLECSSSAFLPLLELPVQVLVAKVQQVPGVKLTQGFQFHCNYSGGELYVLPAVVGDLPGSASSLAWGGQARIIWAPEIPGESAVPH